ncbi:MAG: T9SS type A sorting domain-containing protein [Bacteroidota bacterium]
MKHLLHSGLKILSFIAMMIIVQVLVTSETIAQIYEPEGLNMPGAWNAWTNPPTNNLALANPNQVPGGRLIKVPCEQLHWQTRFNVNTSGADLIGGTYTWLFTSGPPTNYYQNKWAGVTVTMNTLQTYTKEGALDNTATLIDGKWYTVNWEDLGYQDARAIFMETSAEPVAITSVSVPASVFENVPVVITISTAAAPSAEEHFYLTYTTDNWVTSNGVPVTMNGSSGTATIPGLPTSTGVYYYVVSSALAGLTDDYGLCALQLNNNSGVNYYYAIGTPPPPQITWANLQWPGSGEIETGGAFNVYGQVFITGVTGQATPAPGLEAWVGYSTTDTDPSAWTNWVVATHNGPSGSNDEFLADIGSVISSTGTYYYATRFKYNDDPYVYGGFSGGFWDGTTNVSGILTVYDVLPDPDFDWINLQFPGSATIVPGENLDVYAQAYIEGVTGQPEPAPGVEAWIGYSTNNTDPSEWTNWFPAAFNAPSGNNDEYVANLGQFLIDEGTYYYASRFRLNTGEFFYGGYSETGGGPWDGTTNISGILTVQTIINPVINWANLQYPDSGVIVTGQSFDVYAQAWIEGVTGQPEPTPGLEAWIGYSSTDSNPDTWTNWVLASFNAPSGNNDEFFANIGIEFTEPGVWFYASRFRYNEGDFVYGGFSETGGGFWNGIENVSGVLEITEPQQTFPVLFTIIDATELHDAVKLKGEMTAWDTIAMNPDNHTWTLTLDMVPGTYEWGAIEADGTQNGLWLIEGGNLVMTLGEDGTISGMVTYTTLVTNSTNLPVGSEIYPNPVKDALNLYIPGLTGFRIMDINGRLVSHKITTGASQLIDLAGFKSGVYQLDILIGDRTFHQKIVKH